VPAKALTDEKKRTEKIFGRKSRTPVSRGKRAVLFAGAAPFVCGSFSGCLWCIVRIFVPTVSGRQRCNVPGATDAVSHDFHTVCNNTCINALSVCELLEKTGKIYTGKVVNIISDSAKYQKCTLVTEPAEKRNIELLYLPSYCPNLNITERLWKWTEKDCLNCQYYETFALFKEAIDKSLMKTKKARK
jgi:hypothetical protein